MAKSLRKAFAPNSFGHILLRLNLAFSYFLMTYTCLLYCRFSDRHAADISTDAWFGFLEGNYIDCRAFLLLEGPYLF